LYELTIDSARDYLGRFAHAQPGSIRITELGGGVSNTVLLVETGKDRFVLKQSLARLRVNEDWFSDRARVRRESAALRLLEPHLPAGTLPHVLFEDPENYIFSMTAAPPSAIPWKTRLLEGDADPQIARRLGEAFAAMMRASREHTQILQVFDDQTIFDELRLDPYYRATARRNPDLATFFDALIEDCRRHFSLVHGDWSPKNFLVGSDQLIVIDWEVAHVGNPAFDAGFLTNHLLLKSFYLPQWQHRFAAAAGAFWETLRDRLPVDAADWFEPAALKQLSGLLLARIDGKSPVEYITRAEEKQRVRTFARTLIAEPPRSVEEVFSRQAECR
jgi:5-methylthioribose kinase